MMPGLGKGTLTMAFLRNQSTPRATATRLTAVGLRRVSIGPPIRIIDLGQLRDPCCFDISDTAASTGTEGWHTAMTCVSGPSTRSISMT